jgi:sacsin
MELLNELRDNMANICLFLKSIRSIRILQWDMGQISPTLLCACSVKDSDNNLACLIPRILQRKKEDLYAEVKNGSMQSSTWIREITIAFDASQRNTLRYLMSARFGSNVDYQKIYDHIDKNKELGFLPIAGMAALISSNIKDPLESFIKSIAGMTFCFLPLPIRTGFPVQINAYFAVTTDRQAINNKEMTYKTWNSLLRDLVIAPLYAQLLLDARDHLNIEDYYKLFPKSINVSGMLGEFC